ncbi:MAG: ComEC family competence protein [Bacteroidales bacterium]|nr:ComEC family competence protein [Bacteroidales bacterium]
MQLLPIFRKSPFARLLFFLAAGILTANFFHGFSMISFPLLFIALAVLISILMLLIGYGKNLQTDWLSGLLSALILFIAGYINMDIRNLYADREGRKAEIRGIYILQIVDTPEIKVRTVKATARIKWNILHENWNPENQKIMIYMERDSASTALKPGDWLMANIRISNIPPPGNPGEFDYRRYMALRNIYRQTYMKSGDWKLSTYSGGKSIKSLSCLIQGNLLRAYQTIGLNNRLYGILAALTLGYRNDLEASTKQAFSRAGVMHVMALSGFNVAIIAMALGYVLLIFDRSVAGKVFKTAIIILFVWLFAFVTGLSPSVTRAAVMISFVLTGNLLKRHINTYNILFASAFFLLTFSPALLADVSFQLSFSAVLGILVYHPILYRFLFFKNKLADKIWRLFTVSCAAQLSTLPFTLYYFHQFPVYFWLTNLYVIPWVSLIIIFAAVFLIVSAIHPLALIVGKILAVLLGGLYGAVSFTEMLPAALMENIHVSVSQSAVLFLLTLFFALFLLYKNHRLLLISLSLILVFQVLSIFHQMDNADQKIFLVSNLKGISSMSFISGTSGVFWSDSAVSQQNNAVQYALSDFWIEHGVSDHLLFLSDPEKVRDKISGSGHSFCKFPWMGNNLILEFDGQRIAFLSDDRLAVYHSTARLKVDWVIVSGKVKPDLESITKLFDMDLLVLDSSVTRFQALQWKNSGEQMAVPCWYVTEQGAFLQEHKNKMRGSKS